MWLRCSQLWRRAFYDLCPLNGATPSCFVPLLLLLSFLSLFSNTTFLFLSKLSRKFYVSSLNPLISAFMGLWLPPLFPCFNWSCCTFFLFPSVPLSHSSLLPVLSLFLFLSLLLSRSPSFLFCPCWGPSDSQMAEHRNKRVVGGSVVFFLLSLSSVCVLLLAHVLSSLSLSLSL